MPTLLLKDVARECLKLTDRRSRKIIVTLKGGDLLEFRAKGSRIRYQVHLGQCYNLAFANFIEEQYREKINDYKNRKKLGLRARRPRKPMRIFSTKYYAVLN